MARRRVSVDGGVERQWLLHYHRHVATSTQAKAQAQETCTKYKPGVVLKNCYIPWLDRHDVKLIEKRCPKDGEYFINNGSIVVGSGREYVSEAEKKREYWIVEVLD
jgi:collagenase-like PrtC family protease